MPPLSTLSALLALLPSALDAAAVVGELLTRHPSPAGLWQRIRDGLTTPEDAAVLAAREALDAAVLADAVATLALCKTTMDALATVDAAVTWVSAPTDPAPPPDDTGASDTNSGGEGVEGESP